MMLQAHIQDRVRWGLNVAARRVGEYADAYRPSGAFSPLGPENRFLRLPAAFSGLRGAFKRPNPYGEPLCEGIFDAAYTRPGDYLVLSIGTWFIASQQPLLPVLCVRTNRVVSFYRAITATSLGVNGYGGVSTEELRPLLASWPASILGTTVSSPTETGLPSDGGVARWTALLPVTAEERLGPGDIMMDDLAQKAVVCGCEFSELGWRVSLKQAAS